MKPRSVSIDKQRCSVLDCPSNRRVKSHRYPFDESVGFKWITATGNPLMKKFTYQQIYQNRYVICHLHFSEEDYQCGIRRRLKQGAVPSRMLPALSENPEENSGGSTWFPTSRDNKLRDNVVPTLRLTDSRNCQLTYINPRNEIDFRSCNHENISINDKNKDETKIDNIFSQEFSSSFKYSDSPNLLYVNDFELPIRGREIVDRKMSVRKDKNIPLVSQTLKRPSTDDLESPESVSENMRPGFDFVKKSVLDIPEKPRFEPENGDFGIVEEPAVIEITRFDCSADNTENGLGTNVAAFQEFQFDDSVNGNTSILRNVLSLGKAANKGKLNKFSVGEAKRAELSYIGRKVFNTEKNVKRQKYKSTIKLKRHSEENGKIIEDIFTIEHTFISTCNQCPNHKNDSVSCKVIKVK